MKLRKPLAILALILSTTVCAAPKTEEERDAGFRALQWQQGPIAAEIAGKATLKTPADVAFLDEKNSKKFLELTDNIPADGNFIILNTKEDWWASFEFDPSGYVKDDDKIDPDALLKDLQAGDVESNKERQRLGLAELHTVGWFVPPHYDQTTKQLEWGAKLRSGDEDVINYTIRILGRTGVTSATLVSSPDKLQADMQSFRAVLPGFEYKAGEKYAEFRPGDHVAEYGLAALVAGGAAAIATKKGLWGVIGTFLAASWKLVAGAFVAIGAAIKSFFKRDKS